MFSNHLRNGGIIMDNVVERIRELTAKKGWSIYELSAQTGISINSIYEWFKSGAEPSVGNIIKICDSMELSLEQFFCGNEMYQLNDDENKILEEWFRLSDLEKSTIFNLIDTFKILKAKQSKK